MFDFRYFGGLLGLKNIGGSQPDDECQIFTEDELGIPWPT
jgi:hypothetical protein